MENDPPRRWKVAIISALAMGIVSALNIPESYGMVATFLASIL
jgi:hypothetical protein